MELTLEFSCLYFQSKDLLIVYIICPSWNNSIGSVSFNVAIQGNNTETSPTWPVRGKAPGLAAWEHHDVISSYSGTCSWISRTCNYYYMLNEIIKLISVICSTPLVVFLSFSQLLMIISGSPQLFFRYEEYLDNIT